jgi:UDP-N-acetylglucosamine--N-acetylmuramyl-(pentapeptide) pyrophosphoryl-undecaprenol N-acetylglucosamine transferase
VAEALKERGVRVSFAAPPRPETRLLTDSGYDVDLFAVEGIPRELSLRSLRAAGTDVAAPVACRRILSGRRPGVVLGAGGYVGGPLVLAAWSLGVPGAVMEADAHLGLANRLATPFSRRVFLAYPLTERDGDKYRVVGRPLPRRSRAPGDGAAARRHFGLPETGLVVLVVGGSLGARRLNEAALDAFGDPEQALELPAVLHLAGARDYAELAARTLRPEYRLLEFTDEFGAALAAADLVVSRAGGVVWEIAAAGKPALLVPYPHATAEHQTKNALYFERAGGAVLVPEEELDLRGQVTELLGDEPRLTRMADAMRAVARPDAAEAVATELIALGRGRAEGDTS